MKNKISLLGLIYSSVLLASFYQSATFTDAYIVPKHFFMVFSGILGIVAIVIHYYSRKEALKITINRNDLCISAFLLYCTLHFLFRGNNPFINRDYWTLLIVTILYFLFRPKFENDTNYRQTFFWSILILGGIQALFGLLQQMDLIKQMQTNFSLSGAYGNPGSYANLLVALLPFSAVAALAFPKGRQRNIAFLSTGLILIILPFTQARTSWLATLLVVAYLLAHTPYGISLINNLKASLIRILISLFVLIILAAAGYYALTSFKQESASGRLFVWKVTLDMIKDKPVFGHGYNSYQSVHNDFQAQHFRNNPKDWKNAYLADQVKYSFNEYLQMASEIGILGLIVFLSILFYLFRRKKYEAINNTNYYSIGAEASMLAILFSALLSYPLKNVPVLFLLYTNFSILSGNDRDYVIQWELRNRVKKVLLGVAIICSIIAFRFMLIRFNAQKEWFEVFQAARRNEEQIVRKKYAGLLPVLKYDRFFVYNYGAEMAILKDYKKSLALLESEACKMNDCDYYIYLGTNYLNLGDTFMALKYFKQASEIMPVRFYPKYKMVLVYKHIDQIENARKLAREILEMPVKVDSKLVQDIKLEMRKLLYE